MIEALLLLLAGPISKWDDKRVEDDFQSEARLNDIERCLIDLDGILAPYVYRQPDRPDVVTILYVAGNSGIAAGKVVIESSGNRSRVRVWGANWKGIRRCAPPASN